MRFWRPGCAEFPNDNPELHDGARWLCSSTRAAASAVAAGDKRTSARATAEFPFPDDAEVREQLRSGLGRTDFAGSALEELTAPAAGTREPAAVGTPPPVWRPSAADIDPFIQELQALIEPLSAPLAPTRAEASVAPRAPAAAEQPQIITEGEAPGPDLPAVHDSPLGPHHPGLFEFEPALRGETAAAPPPVAAVAAPDAASAVPTLPLGTAPALPGLSFRVPRPDAVLSPLTHLTATTGAGVLELDLTPPPPGLAGWEDLVCKLQEFLLARGATRAAALLGPLLNGERAELSQLGPRVARALVKAGVADGEGQRLRPTVRFQAAVAALRESFTLGGGNPVAGRALCVSLVEALLASAAGKEAIESHLRKAGLDSLLHRAA